MASSSEEHTQLATRVHDMATSLYADVVPRLGELADREGGVLQEVHREVEDALFNLMEAAKKLDPFVERSEPRT